jgi:hypothetical protein
LLRFLGIRESPLGGLVNVAPGRLNSFQAAPLVSVASSRVSLMVRRKTRTDAGASSRCDVAASTREL